MREIKFRVWNNNTNKYEYTELDCYFVIDQRFKEYEYEQYTGLKDKNGKDIYEGDIVKVCDKHVSFVHMHPSGEWVLPQFLHKEDEPITTLLWHCDKEQVEAIGNIHENPELLEEGE